MKLIRFTAAMAILAVSAAFSGAALAEDARATSTVNVRTGPGTSYQAVARLHEGMVVDVDRCTPTRNWCYVAGNGIRGWVSARYLARITGSDPTSSSGSAQQGLSFGFTIGDDGSGISIGIGNNNTNNNNNNGPRVPDDPVVSTGPGQAEICFYEDENFRGRNFCIRQYGARENLTGYWQDQISSVEVSGDMSVFICTNANLRGTCGSVDQSYAGLGPNLNNAISSFEVE